VDAHPRLTGRLRSILFTCQIDAHPSALSVRLTTLVSCLPVLVLAMGTALAHMIRADTTEADQPGTNLTGPADQRTAGQPQPDHPPVREDRGLPDGEPPTRPADEARRPPGRGTGSPRPSHVAQTTRSPSQPEPNWPAGSPVTLPAAGSGYREGRSAAPASPARTRP
jgi:hypothetical protein